MIDSFSGDYEFLSNFYPCKVTMDKHEYSSVEHAYQAAKTLDLRWRETIRDALTPGMAKKLGRVAPIRPDWLDVKDGIMYDLLFQKFAWVRNPELKQKLQDTGDEKLVEGNWWGDTYWGVCNGRGSNKLGEMLMSIRGLVRQNG